MKDSVKTFKELKELLQRAKQKSSRLEGSKETLTKQLKEVSGCETIDEALKVRDSLVDKRKSLEAERDGKIEEFADKYSGLLEKEEA